VSTSSSTSFPFQDPKRSVEERVADLLSRLSLDEKLAQMSYTAPAVPRLGIPGYNWWNEALHGVARAGLATVFPQAIAMAATFEPELVERVAETISLEARAKFNVGFDLHGEAKQYQGLTFWTPNINIFRDPRWGRGQETYGEDPFLTGRMGRAFVRGLQGSNGGTGGYMRAAACAKHYAVHSGPEALRHEFNAQVSQKDLYETYLPAFEELVDEGVEAVMGAYNRVNGEPACGSPFLLEKTLRQQWGFTGHVVSDCWAVRDFHTHHKITSGPVESAALAVNNGCDLNCGNTYEYAREAVDRRMISEDRIDEAVARLMTARIKLGLLDPPEKRPYRDLTPESIDWETHADLAREVAERSFVLLKNSDDLLPLDAASISKIYVTGPHATDVDVLMGNYHGVGTRFSSILEGVSRRAGHGVKVEYRPGCLTDRPNVNEAQWAAFESEDADVTVVVMGIHPFLEGEEGDAIASPTKGDRARVELPEPQRAYLAELRRRGKRVVLLLTGGSAVALEGVDELADAVLMVWYPGQAGGEAVGRVLFGDVSPSGKLPVSIPNRTEDLPDFDDYRMTGRTYRYSHGARYPFGFGLSYGRAVFRGLRIGAASCGTSSAGAGVAAERGEAGSSAGGEATIELPETVFDFRGGAARRADKPFPADGPDGRITLCVGVKNESSRDLRETIQIYASHPDHPSAPRYQLCGLRTVSLAAGSEGEFEVPVSLRALMLVDENGVGALPEAAVEFSAGASSPGGEAAGAPEPTRLRTRLVRRGR